MKKKKKNIEVGVSYFKDKNLVNAHQNKHPKGVGYVVAQK
jgi:hypothetical protein